MKAKALQMLIEPFWDFETPCSPIFTSLPLNPWGAYKGVLAACPQEQQALDCFAKAHVIRDNIPPKNEFLHMPLCLLSCCLIQASPFSFNCV